MKPLHWIGSAHKAVRSFPDDVKSEVGYSLYLAQNGVKAHNANPMVGFGSSKVVEVTVDNDGNTYRAVYTVRFPKAVYALHAFQKKSNRGIKTPQHDIDLLHSRLKLAAAHHKITYETTEQKERADGQGK
ncbi:MAG: hypothetical protein FJX47_06745 [Alphaproteobacteria bacterium]|nr:hypothetical protein [Alphaproteobacteria bacterium]